MKFPEITLSRPLHPVFTEMISATEDAVRYQVIGERFRDGGSISGVSNPVIHFAYDMAVRMRRYAAGAIAYNRARSALLLRQAPRSQLVYACSHLVYGGYPWIGEYENVNALAFYSPALLRNGRFAEHLRRLLGGPDCRAIRVYSPSAALSFRAIFQDEAVHRKLHVIHPTIKFPAEGREFPCRGGIPRILFIGRGFWVKGGALFLQAVVKLRRAFEFRVDFISDLPSECDHYRTELEGTVNFYPVGFSRTELYTRFYRASDIFVMLGMADSYGMVLVEASAFGLPIVAMRLDSGVSDVLRLTGNAIQVEPDHQIFDSSGVHCVEPEELVRQIRTDASTGVVDRIVDALAALISDRSLREEMGARGRAAVFDGPLSVHNMRQSMLDLYATVTG